MKSPREILGVAPAASPEEIKAAYRRLAMQHHPDRNPGDDAALKRFHEVQAAYDQLANPKSSGVIRPRRKPFSSFMDDFYSRMFGDGEPVSRGPPVETEVYVDFTDMAKGGEVVANYQRRSLCDQCGGWGGERAVCETCGGSGVHIHHGPAAVVQISCHSCGGEGQTVVGTCSGCSGTGYGKVEELSQSVPYEAGVLDGTQFRFAGLGQAAPGGKPGDLYVTVRVKPHNLFSRLPKGGLLVELPLSYAQVVLGSEVPVPTLSGSVSLRIPPGSQPGSQLRLRGMGLPFRLNGLNTTGDLFAVIQLDVPKAVSGRCRELLEELARHEQDEPSLSWRQYLEKVNGRSDTQ